MIYKTRVKQYTSMPYFEAGTERFVRDWRSAVVRVQVRDARYVLCGCFGLDLWDLERRGADLEKTGRV